MSVSDSGQKLNVFVSSTSKDLDDWRKVAEKAIKEMDWVPVMMEYFEAMPERTVEACYKKLQDCGLMVLIIAWRKGYAPTVEQGGNGEDSITALELKFAREHHIPVLAFMANDDWPGKLWDKGPDRDWIESFRSNLNLPAKFFKSEDTPDKPNFFADLKNALVTFKKEHLPEQSPVLSSISQVKFDQVSERLRYGKCIPFLGYGVYEEGPLSTSFLIQAFELKYQEPSLATAAEFRERFLDDREFFLSSLEEIIRKETQEVAAPAIHDLLLRIKPPPLIVSATVDLLLEDRLTGEGKAPLIFCHVISSEGGAYDGKVLQFRGPEDTKPKFLPADQIFLDDVPEGTYIIYKPLGSPFLNRRLDADLKIDTVVLTESDHLTLFGRLKNQSTGVPTAFSKYFINNPMVFLGYPMDLWQFRLVGQVLKDSLVLQKKSVAVRIPAPGMEEMAWGRLNIDLLPMDCNEFARKVKETL